MQLSADHLSAFTCASRWPPP